MLPPKNMWTSLVWDAPRAMLMFQGYTELALFLAWLAWESWPLGHENRKILPVPHWSSSGVGGEEIVPPSMILLPCLDSGRANPGDVGAGELASPLTGVMQESCPYPSPASALEKEGADPDGVSGGELVPLLADCHNQES